MDSCLYACCDCFASFSCYLRLGGGGGGTTQYCNTTFSFVHQSLVGIRHVFEDTLGCVVVWCRIVWQHVLYWSEKGDWQCCEPTGSCEFFVRVDQNTGQAEISPPPFRSISATFLAVVVRHGDDRGMRRHVSRHLSGQNGGDTGHVDGRCFWSLPFPSPSLVNCGPTNCAKSEPLTHWTRKTKKKEMTATTTMTMARKGKITNIQMDKNMVRVSKLHSKLFSRQVVNASGGSWAEGLLPAERVLCSFFECTFASRLSHLLALPVALVFPTTQADSLLCTVCCCTDCSGSTSVQSHNAKQRTAEQMLMPFSFFLHKRSCHPACQSVESKM